MSIRLTDARRGVGFVTGYLLGTPLFLVIDMLFDAPVRVAALQDSNSRFVSYGAAFTCGVGSRARPNLEAWIGMGESAFNILLLILAIMVPVWDLTDAALANQPLVSPFDNISIANFLLSASMLTVAFYTSQARASTGRGTR